MARGATKIHQPPFGENQHRVSVRKDVLVVLRLDIDALHTFHFLQAGHVDLVVEVADVPDDRFVLHPRHVVGGDDVEVAGRGDEDVGGLEHVVEPLHLVAFHAGLQCADRIDLRDHDARALAA